MTFLERLKFILSGKESQARILMAMNQVGQPVNTPANYENFAKKGYSKNVIVYTAISKITSACKGIKWEAYSKNRDGSKTEISESPLLELMSRPNPLQSTSDFMESVVGFKLIAGNSYIEANQPRTNKPPLELWPVRPDKMKIIPGANGLPVAYEFSFNGKVKRWPVDLVKMQSLILHWKSFNPLNDWYGLSPLEAAMLSLDQSNAGQIWNLATLQNSAIPSGVLQMKISDANPRGNLSDEQFKRLKAELEENYQGSKNTGRPMVLEGGLQWQSISLSPKEMDFLKGKEVTATDLVLAYGVPPELMGLGQKTFNNYKEARLAFYEETVLPMMDDIENMFNHWLAPSFGDNIYLSYDRDDIEALVYRREQKYTSLQGVNFLTQNEKRGAVGYESKPGLDFFVVGSQLIDEEGNILSGGMNETESGNTEQDTNTDEGGNEEDPQEDDNTQEENENSEESENEEAGKSWKSINLVSANEKRQTWYRQNRKRRQLADPFSSELNGEYKQLISKLASIANRLKGSDAKLIEYALQKEINDHKDEFSKIISKHIKKTFDIFGQMILREGKELGFAQEVKANLKFDDFVKRYIEKHTAEAVKSITNTNVKKMRSIIKEWTQEAITAGDTLPELSQFLEMEFEEISKSQAMRIARTEVSLASNNGTLEAAKSLNIPNLWKEWVTANDDRVRDGGPNNDEPDHGAMNGASVPIDEKFGVPPDTLMEGPGDNSAPAGQVINCRCVLAFRTREE